MYGDGLFNLRTSSMQIKKSMATGATVVKPVVSGKIGTQTCILTASYNKENYYMTSDINGVPFFMKLRRGTSSGLDVFKTYVLKVNPTLVNGAKTPVLTMTNASSGAYYVANRIGNYVQQPDPASKDYFLAINDQGYYDHSLFANSVSYKLLDPLNFIFSFDYYDNPSVINITTIGNTFFYNTFFVTQVTNLLNSEGVVSTDNVYNSLYSNLTNDGSQVTYFFTDSNAILDGDGVPFSYCLTQGCGPTCLGVCDNHDGKFNYEQCRRLTKTSDFKCIVQPTGTCSAYFVVGFVVLWGGVFLLMAAFLFIELRKNNPMKHITATPTGADIFGDVPSTHKLEITNAKHGGHFTVGGKVFWIVALSIWCFLPVIFYIVMHFDKSVANRLIGSGCSI